jgi:hypothetical protein
VTTTSGTLTQQTLIKYLKDLNPAIDTSDPIIQDLVVNFGTQVITDVQTRVSYLNSRYTNAYLNQLNDTELNIYAYNAFGLVREPGTPVTGYVYFMFSTPSDNGSVSIPTNSVVSTSDGKWRFTTTEPVYISADSLPSFYNPVRNAYELRIPVQAVSPGTDYRVASYRLVKIQSTLNFSAKCENREPFTSGTDPETRTDFINRINSTKAGFNLNTTSGLRDSILSNVKGISDVQWLHAPGNRNTYDLYYIGYQPVADVLEYVISNPLYREIPFNSAKTPIRYVDGVVVDSVSLTQDQYRFTPTKVILHSTVPLNSGSQIFVSYQYNQLNNTLKGYLESTLDFPGAVWNVNEAKPVFIKVAVKVKPQAYMTLSEVSALVSDTVYSYLNPNQFVTDFQASKVRSLILDVHTYILDCAVSINGQPFLDFEQGQYPVLTSDNLEISLL